MKIKMTLLALAFGGGGGICAVASEKPNILIVWGNDNGLKNRNRLAR